MMENPVEENFEEKLKEIAELYDTYVVSYYSVLISLNGGVKPLAILIEAENFLTHLFNAILYPESEETNLRRAKAHIERMILDLYKLLWREINLKLEEKVKVKKLNFEDYGEFKKKSKEAREEELKHIGMDKTVVFKKYKECIDFGLKLFYGE